MDAKTEETLLKRIANCSIRLDMIAVSVRAIKEKIAIGQMDNSEPETPEPETEKKQDSKSKPTLDFVSRGLASGQTRQEVIDFVANSNDRFRQNLARELNCTMAEAPDKMAEYLGFAEEK